MVKTKDKSTIACDQTFSMFYELFDKKWTKLSLLQTLYSTTIITPYDYNATYGSIFKLVSNYNSV